MVNQKIPNERRNNITTPSKKTAFPLNRNLLRKYLVSNPSSIKELSILALTYLRDGRHRDAAVEYRKCSIIAPGSTAALNNIANLFLLQSNVAEAYEVFRKSLIIKPNQIKVSAEVVRISLERFSNPNISHYIKFLLSSPVEENRRIFIELGRAFLHFHAYRAAILFFEKIPITEPDHLAEIMSSVGLCLFHLGKIRALDSLKRAAISGPDQFEVNNAICSLFIERKIPSAELWVSICSKIHPFERKRYLIFGRYYIDNQKWVEARLILQEIIQRESDEIALSMFVTVLVKEKSLCELEALAEVTISQKLGAVFYNNLIVGLSELNSQKFGLLAQSIFLKKFEESRIYYNIGLYYYNSEEFSIAYKYFRMAGTLHPGYFKAFNQIAICESNFYKPKKAYHISSWAVACSPYSPNAWMNRALYSKALRKIHHSIILLRKAIDVAGGNYPDAEYNLALALFSIGDISGAYKAYRSRWRTSAFFEFRKKPIFPEWQGPAFTPNADLFLFMEQGMGDEVTHSWILPYVRRDCKSLTVECDPRLVEIFKRSFSNIDFFARENDFRYFENSNAASDTRFQLPVVQAGEFYVDQIRCQITGLSADLENAACNFTPRLKVCENKNRFWGHWVSGFRSKFLTIGVAWRSGFRNHLRNQQYIEIEELARVIPPNTLVVNLQYDFTAEEEERFLQVSEKMNFKFITPPNIDLKNDLEDIFAIMSNVDLVVSPLISIPWMASAIGTQSLVFRSNENKHIWLQFGLPFIPWAPNIKLFFRSPWEPWDGPISNIRAELISRTVGTEAG